MSYDRRTFSSGQLKYYYKFKFFKRSCFRKKTLCTPAVFVVTREMPFYRSEKHMRKNIMSKRKDLRGWHLIYYLVKGTPNLYEMLNLYSSIFAT